jgi:hypothetical protein
MGISNRIGVIIRSIRQSVHQFAVWLLPSYRDGPKSVMDHAFILEGKANGQIDYSELRWYAQRLVEVQEKDDKIIEEKADSLLKFYGGGSVLVFVGFILAFKPSESCFVSGLFLWMIPSIAASLLSLITCVIVRWPRDYNTKHV